ncbi:MAG: hypothetical protein ACR2P3_00330 [Geminicoccaceae bacterium]
MSDSLRWTNTSSKGPAGKIDCLTAWGYPLEITRLSLKPCIVAFRLEWRREHENVRTLQFQTLTEAKTAAQDWADEMDSFGHDNLPKLYPEDFERPTVPIRPNKRSWF